MPDYPAEIIHAAVEALMERRGLTSESSRLWAAPIVATVLDTAAPLLAENCAQAILAHMEAHQPGGWENETARLRYRRYMRTVAQVAATAFSTDEELKHQAAKALATGNYVACEIPEPGE